MPAITELNLWRVTVPLLTEWTASLEFGEHPIDHRFILRITDSDGFEGWAETGAVGSDELLETTLSMLVSKPLGDLRLGFLDLWPGGSLYWQRPAPPSPYAPNPANLQHRLRHPLQSLVEMSLSDLIARRAGMPLCHLWGGTWRDRVLVDYWMPRTTPEQAQRCVRRGKALGFSGAKLKTTLEDPNIERLEAIRDAAPDWHLTVDANGRFYRLDNAPPTLREMDRVGNVAIFEDPFPRFHLNEFVRLRDLVQARVVVHVDPPESLWNVMRSEAAGGLNIGSGVGLFHWRIMAGAADLANLPIWNGSSLDLGIATAAQLHLCASAPNCTLPSDQAGPWLRESHLLKHDFVIQDGHIILPTGPGLGIEVDLDALEKYSTQSRSWKA